MASNSLALVSALFGALVLLLVSACTTSVQIDKPACSAPYVLVGTSCCLDKNNNSMCDTDEENKKKESSGEPGAITGRVIADSDTLPKQQKIGDSSEAKQKSSYIDKNKLIEDIKEVMDSEYYQFEQDSSNPDYTRSSSLKYYVIHTINDEDEHINDAKEFCDKYCAENWDGWKYFQNMSNFKLLHPILGRENFTSDREYKEYAQDAGYIRFKITETPYEVENGKVLEYQLYTDYTDLFGTFLGVYDDSLIIYKVFCSPNATIFLRPKTEDLGEIRFGSSKLEEVDRTWDNNLIPIRKELLKKADKILERCPVSKEFFEDYQFRDYSKSELLTFYWRTYLKYDFNLTRSLSVGIEPSREEGKYVLKQINLSFTNNDEFELYDVKLEIDVIADDKSRTGYYDKELYGTYKPGGVIYSNAFKLKDIAFKDNITIIPTLYSIEEKGEIRPETFVFTKDNLKANSKS